MRTCRLISAFALANLAFGHNGRPLEPHDLAGAWSFEPGILITVALTAVLFAFGARASRGVTRTQSACFWSGWILLVLSLISPLHSIGDTLFSAHMVQHEILMLGAAPLLV